MKLVELLAREWSEWPGNCDYAVCDSDGEIRAIGTGTNNDFYPATAVDLEDRLNGTALLVSDDGKRVTRSGWSAERARIAKPAKKADKDGWIRHRSGKCPVEAGTVIEYRERNGNIEVECEPELLGSMWFHESHPHDIMAYRLHKPAEQVEVCSKPDPRNSAKRDSDYVCWMRDRITEIDATTQALTTERAELVQKLASEGFALIGRINDLLTEAAQKHEDMSDWRNWRAGDIVRYEGLPDFHSKYFTIGNLYEIKLVETGDDCKNIYNPVIFKADDSGEENGWQPELFKFHSRPSA